MKDKTKEAVADMQRGNARKVKARLTKKGQHTLRQFTKQAQNLVDEIEIGKRSFPDHGTRSAMRQLVGSLEDHLEAVKEVAEAAGEDQIVDIIEEAADAFSGVDHGEEEDQESEDHDVEVSGLAEREDDEQVDIGEIDETAIV